MSKEEWETKMAEWTRLNMELRDQSPVREVPRPATPEEMRSELRHREHMRVLRQQADALEKLAVALVELERYGITVHKPRGAGWSERLRGWLRGRREAAAGAAASRGWP